MNIDTTALEALFDTSPTHLDAAQGIAAAYQLLLGGVPSVDGFTSLINTAISTNFGAGTGGPAFNQENVFINVANSLVQGNTAAATAFNGLIGGAASLQDQVTALYMTLVPAASQTTEGLNFLIRPDALTFYAAVAAERGVAGANGPAIVAMASMANVFTEGDVPGLGDNINDLIASIRNNTSMLPQGGTDFTPIETADGTAFDMDDVTVVPNQGSTFTLTTGSDNVAGTTLNDTIVGFVNTADAAGTGSTLDPSDTIVGGAGTDALNITISGNGTGNNGLPGANITEVENFFVRNVATAGAQAYDFNAVAGEVQVWNDRSTRAIDFDNVGTGTTIGVKGDGTTMVAATTFDYATAADPVSIAIDGGVKGGAAITATAGAATTATIASTGAANTVGAITLSGGATVTGLTINGATDLTANLVAGDYAANAKVTVAGAAATVDLDGAALAANVGEVDASGLTAGGVHLLVGDGGVTITGGAGNDAVNLQGFAQTKDVMLGAGTADRIEFTAATNYESSASKVTGAEVLRVSGVGSFDVTKVAGATTFEAQATAGTLNLTKLAEAASVSVLGNVTTLDLDLATTTGTNALTVVLDDDATTPAAITVGAINAAGVETLNVTTADALASGTPHIVSAFTGSTSTTTVNVTGDSDLTLTDISALGAGATVDASSFTKILTVGGIGSGDTVKAGSGADMLNIAFGNLSTTTAIEGGTGDDTLTVTGDGSDIVDGDFTGIKGIDNIIIGSTTTTSVNLGGFAQTALGTVDANTDGNLDLTAALLTTGGTFDASSLSTVGVDFAVTNTVAAALNGTATLTVTGGAKADTIAVTQNSAADTGDDVTATNVNGGSGVDVITYTLTPGGGGADVLTVSSTATAVADADIITGFASGTDKFDYNGALTTAPTNVGAGADLAAAVAVGGTDGVYQATNNIANNGANTSGDAFTAVLGSNATNLATNYASLEAQLTGTGGILASAIAGLDAEITNGQTALIALDNGTGSVVLRYTADTSGTANVITADEIDLVGVFTNTAQLAAADFV